jgi:hypothetical protein
MSVALCRSGQHCIEHSIVIELNEKSSLRRYLSLCRASWSLAWKNYSPESGDSLGGATEPHHNI